jgi:hypothetical protein
MPVTFGYRRRIAVDPDDPTAPVRIESRVMADAAAGVQNALSG